MEYANWSVEQLAEYCRKEKEKFFYKSKGKNCYCYELFKKAFKENSNAALKFIYSIYRLQVMNWIQKHSYTKKIPCGEDELFFDIMSHFIFALKHRSIEHFPSLAHIMAYLRKCVHSVIMTTWRKNSLYVDTLEIDCAGIYEDHVDEKITAKAAWQRIENLLEEDKEVLLAQLFYVQNLKPRQILEEYPQHWKDTNEIRVDCQRIKRKLKKDDQLKIILTG